MKKLEEMNVVIYELQQTLNTLIEEKYNLLDTEIIAISQKLDTVLNKYNNLLSKKVS